LHFLGFLRSAASFLFAQRRFVFYNTAFL